MKQAFAIPIQPFNITEVQVVPVKPRDGVIGFASLVVNHSLYLGSIAILTRPNGGYRLLYPTKKIGDVNVDIFYPINKTAADRLENAVLKMYENVMNKGTDNERRSQ